MEPGTSRTTTTGEQGTRKRHLEHGDRAVADANRRAKKQKRIKVDDRGLQVRPPPKLRGETVTSMEAMVRETSYVHLESPIYPDTGLRGVVPYMYTYVSNAKGRWYGQTIAELFVTEFSGVSQDYVAAACAQGRLRIMDQKVSPDLVIRNGDWMLHEMHRHEPPVLDIEPAVVAENDVIVAVNKPCSLPVHPCGRYRHNSVIFWMAHHGRSPLYPLYRLDRLTSGVLLFAKHKEASKTYAEAIKHRHVTKTYLARVVGEFPDTADGPITVDAPLTNSNARVGHIVVDPDGGKPAVTLFERVWTAAGVSVVRCKPITGRTHQIRVHLAHLGFPIENDPLYNEAYKAELAARDPLAVSVLSETLIGPLAPSDPNYNPICEVCSGRNTYTKPEGLTLVLYLHALVYTIASDGGDLDTLDDRPNADLWTFETPFPDWATNPAADPDADTARAPAPDAADNP